MDLKEFIQNKRPNLSESSVTTYTSILANLHKAVYPSQELAIKNFSNTTKILKHLEDEPARKRKTVLSALVSITDDDKYRTQMLADVSKYNRDIKKQEKTATQKENWLETDELMSKISSHKRNAELLYRKKFITEKDLQEIQQYIILSLFNPEYIVPRRSKDYTDFKIADIDKANDNYLDKNNFVFNSYKTAGTYGTQRVKIPVKLKNIIAKWIKYNPTEYLLFDKNLQRLTSVKLNQRLNKIFDRKIAVNALRHTFLTDKYKNTIKEQEELAEDMEDMGSSVNMSTTYIKK